MHYLDNAATTRVLPEAAEAAVHAMCEEFGNPSSLHRMGLEASHLLEDSRRTVASALGCLPEEVYFTACGTESTNISLRGAAHLNRHKKGRIITTEIEHAATVNTAKQLAADGFDVVFLAPDATGHITPEVLSEALTEDTILLSCQLVNNEIGTVQPVDQRFHGADKPRGQYEIPIAVVVLRAVKSVQVIPEPGGKLCDELARLPGGRFQPFGIGQRFRRHVETGFFG